MPLNFETRHYADICSDHLSEEDHRLLTRLALGPRDPKKPENVFLVNLDVIGRDRNELGFFVAIGTEFTAQDKAFLTKAGFSEAFARLIGELDAQDIRYVRFDPESPEVDGAELFE